MKRIGILFKLTLLGIASTTLSVRLMERIDWSRWTWRHGTCWESGPCDPPRLAEALLLVYLFLPLLSHIAAGARVRTAEWTFRKILLTISASLTATFLFHTMMRLAMGN